MRFAVCATQEVRAELASILQHICAQRSIAFSLRQYKTHRDLLYDIEDGAVATLVFLEISGDIAPLKELREAGFEGDVILMSRSAASAVEGYAYHAADYWMLPLSHAAIEPRLVLFDAFAHLACLAVKCRGAIVRVPYRDIVFVESRNAKCIIHRAGGEELTVYRKLDDIEGALADARFLRCHQSFLVNMDHVVCADRHFETDDGRVVAIRQRELHRMRAHYAAYIEAQRAVVTDAAKLLHSRG